MNLLYRINAFSNISDKVLSFAAPLLDLGIRIWIAQIFFKSGLSKIQSWESTLMLFEYEYSVPLLSPTFAAWLATAAELVLPILLVIGLLSRSSALALFILNVVAVMSYPDISIAGVKDHLLWGVMLAFICIHGPGAISLDRWIRNRFFQSNLS